MKKVDKLFVNDVVEFLNDANGYAPTKKSVTCEQFGYASTAALEQDTCYDNIDIEANHALKICINDTEHIYKLGYIVMSNTYFATKVYEYFNCKNKEIDGVYTYCPLRSYPICESNAYCGIDCAIFTYSGMYYAAFHVRSDIYELHRISDNTYNNMARLMMYDVYPHTTSRIVKTNLDVRQEQSKMLREDIMDICMLCYRKKIHVTRELEY